MGNCNGGKMKNQIFLKNIDSLNLSTFETLEASQNWLDKCQDPNRVIPCRVWYFDGGGFNGNYSRLCVVSEPFEQIKTTEKFLTNNVSEYYALLMALKLADCHDILVGDSQLVIKQVLRDWNCRAPHLKGICKYCQELVKQKQITLMWVPRKKNLAGVLLENDKRPINYKKTT